MQPADPTIPLVEVQAQWLAVLAGRLQPAGRATMDAAIAVHHRELARTAVNSARDALEAAIRAGRA